MAAEQTFQGEPVISEAEARARGFRALTTAYVGPVEAEMLRGVIADMRRGHCCFALVRPARGGFEVWRAAPVNFSRPNENQTKKP
jgi:hypothetical protein